MSDSEDIRLGNRSSDDSLLLDDSNTGVRWVDTETEPMAGPLRYDAPSSTNFRSMQINSSVDVDGEWCRKTTLAVEGSQSVYDVARQTRLSFSGEESEVPLLSNDSWTVPDSVSHCHPESIIPANNAAWRHLMSATILCLFFMIAEIIGGQYSGSIAIMTDAAHLFSDLVGLIVSLSAVWLGQRPPTKALSFGFYRAEVLGALFSIFFIWVLTGVFVYVAIMRLVHETINIEADKMMAVAAGGIVLNIIMGIVLHGGCQRHSHIGSYQHLPVLSDDHENGDLNQITPCSHRTNLNRTQAFSPNAAVAQEGSGFNKLTNINVRAAAIHVMGDLIQSIGVFIAAVIIKFHPEAKIADPICTFLFAILVLSTTIPLLRDTCLILLEGFPPTISYSNVFAVLNDIPGVKHVHSLHIWSLTAGKHALSVHLAVDQDIDRDTVTYKAQHILQTRFGIHFCTIQTENFNNVLMSSCFYCKPLVS